MIPIEIPDKLNGKTFYDEILPSIYKRIIQGDYLIDFDMHRTELANPEGLVNLLAAAAMIRRKSGYIPQLYLPESQNLIEYMRGAGLSMWATVPGCEALRFNFYLENDMNEGHRQSNFFRPQFYGLFTHSNEGTSFNKHVSNIENIIFEIADSLREAVDADNLSRYCRTLGLSLVQVLKNALEHNNGYRGTLAYYMIQKTPYNTIDFVCSDIGQGILERMKKMLKEKDEEALRKYGHLEQKLNNKEFLFVEGPDNPNLLAITHAVKYREDSEIPGLHKIKEFVMKYDGLFSIHSGNYTVKYRMNRIDTFFHKDSYFSGCHLKMEINTTNPTGK